MVYSLLLSDCISTTLSGGSFIVFMPSSAHTSHSFIDYLFLANCLYFICCHKRGFIVFFNNQGLIARVYTFKTNTK